MHMFIGQQRSNMLLRLGTLALLAYTSHGFVMSLGCGPSERALSRREAISKVSLAGAAAAVLAKPSGAFAAAGKVNKSLGQESFRRIRDARQQLDLVDVPLRSRKFEEVQEVLDSGATVDLEASLVGLVKSNSLPADDRLAVGTIRRYGLAADALIALGGLSAAARDGDGGEARRMLTLTKESLNDILTIGVNNDLNKTN
ncbi:unnamed protein product [Ectocarpus sp. 4 AP-2014]